MIRKYGIKFKKNETQVWHEAFQEDYVYHERRIKYYSAKEEEIQHVKYTLQCFKTFPFSELDETYDVTLLMLFQSVFFCFLMQRAS